MARGSGSGHAGTSGRLSSIRSGVCTVNANSFAVLALSMVAFATPASGGQFARYSPAQAMPEGDSDTDMQTGHAVLLMTNPKGAAGKSDWIKFKTDSCGTLLAIDNGRSIVRKTSFDDDFDDEDPSDLGKDMVGQWLSEHSEIAVVGDGVDRSCEDGGFFFDEDLPSDIDA